MNTIVIVQCVDANLCKWIPESAARTAEGADYVKYFCDTEFYEKWLKQQKEEKNMSDSHDD